MWRREYFDLWKSCCELVIRYWRLVRGVLCLKKATLLHINYSCTERLSVVEGFMLSFGFHFKITRWVLETDTTVNCKERQFETSSKIWLTIRWFTLHYVYIRQMLNTAFVTWPQAWKFGFYKTVQKRNDQQHVCVYIVTQHGASETNHRWRCRFSYKAHFQQNKTIQYFADWFLNLISATSKALWHYLRQYSL